MRVQFSFQSFRFLLLRVAVFIIRRGFGGDVKGQQDLRRVGSMSSWQLN